METFKSCIIGNHELRIAQDEIYWHDKVISSHVQSPTKIRFGAVPFQVDMFTIGTNFKIDLSNEKNKKLSISIKSFLGIQRNKKYDLFCHVLNFLWEEIFFQVEQDLNLNWANGTRINFDNFEIDSNGITKRGLENKTGLSISFQEMKIIKRYDHLLINSKKDHQKFMKLKYLDIWNASILAEILQQAQEKYSE